MVKIAITGSRRWENKLKLKNAIFALKTKYKSDITIVSGGTGEGVDLLIKKYCVEFGVNYVEARPNHMEWSTYCIEPPYMYSKYYKPNNYYIRNTKLINYSDVIILYVTKDDTSDVMKDIIKRCNKKGKKIKILVE